MACKPTIYTDSKNIQIFKREYISQPGDTPELADQAYLAEQS